MKINLITAPIFFLIAFMLSSCETTNSVTSETNSNLFNKDQIVIKRDRYNTPHIFANGMYGVYYGYGYSLAQDRLYQLEILKHSTQGTVSSVLGKEFIAFDKTQRALFWPEDIKSEVNNLSPQLDDVLNGMAHGLNNYLAEVQKDPDNLLPKEFIDNDFMPSSWTKYDVAMLYIGSMLLRYGDFNTEIANLGFYTELVEQHGEAKAKSIFNSVNPRDNDFAPTVIPSKDWSVNTTSDKEFPIDLIAQLNMDPSERGREFSNALVLGSSHLKDDKAILLNGPQFGWFIPAYSYSAGFHTPDWNAVGNAPVGYPMPMMGYNQHISWGSTWGASDNVDLFAETLNPENPEQYKYKGDWKNLDKRVVQLKVKNSDDIVYSAYKSVHGPIVQIAKDNKTAYAKSRGWTGREFMTLEGWIEATQAKNHKEWLQATSKSALNVNWYFADRKGNIAYLAGGAYPERATGHDNRFPVSGEGNMDWIGIKPASSNPQILNPDTGYIANWNNKPGKAFQNPDEWWYSWSEADRIETLNNMVKQRGKMTADEAWNLMMDASYVDPNAHFFKPLMIQAIGNTTKENVDYLAIKNILESWDNGFSAMQASGSHEQGNSYTDPGNAVFRAWLGAMLKETLANDLPGNIGAAVSNTTGYGTAKKPTAAGTNISTGLKLLYEVLQNRTDYDFLNGKTATAVWMTALDKALLELETTYASTDPQDWLLAVPSTRLQYKNFLGIPQTSVDAQYDGLHEMNRGTENNMTVFTEHNNVIGYEVVPPGQSGFISPQGIPSPHLSDQLDLFRNHDKKRTWLFEDDIDENTVTTLTLIIKN